MTETVLTAASAYVLQNGSALGRTSFVDRLRFFLLWLLGLSGALVMIEPAPYELVALIAIIVFAASGLSLRGAHLPLLFLLLLLSIGFVIGVLPVMTLEGTAIWTAVSCFLAVTTLFYALALAEDTEIRLEMLLKGYVLGALLACLVGMLAYFRLIPGEDVFVLYSRVRATFKDPNVFAAYLVLPALVVLARTMFGRGRERFTAALMLLAIAGGLFLSFSRGAWGHFAASAALFLALSYVTRRSALERVRIVVFTGVVCAALAVLIVALLSIPQVESLFQDRASLVQGYDAGPMGRFGRHVLGSLLMLDHPFGIGPLQFSKYFPEDPHNSILASFAAGGWLSGCAFTALMLVTLLAGLRYVLVPTPLQPSFIAVYATFVGELGESYVIDVLHWRHFFMIIGIVWALIIVTNARLRAAPKTSRALSDSI